MRLLSIGTGNLIKEIAFYQALAFVLSFFTGRGERILINFAYFAVFTNCVALSCRIPFTLAVRRWGFTGWPRPKQIAFSVASVTAGASLGTALAFSLISLFTVGRVEIAWGNYIRTAGGSLAVASLAVVLVLGFYLLQETLEDQALESERLRRLQARTEAMVLKSKLNPHFLFNTLDTMLGLVSTDPDRVEEMILTLSSIYRKMLRFPERTVVTLEEELELVAEYLALEKLRLGERLSYEVQLPEELKEEPIPPLLVQPLVENAILHGISRKEGGGTVRVTARRGGRGMTVTVEDNGTGMERHDAIGFGLYSVREQLRHLYGERGLMELRPKQGGGTVVTLKWPLPDANTGS